MVSHPVLEQTASSCSAWSPSPRGALCWGWVWGWAWDAVHRLPGGECATSHPGRCSSRWSARRWSRVRPLGSPGFQRNSWDLQSAEEYSIYSKLERLFVTCNLFICISCWLLFRLWRKHTWNETPSLHPSPFRNKHFLKKYIHSLSRWCCWRRAEVTEARKGTQSELESPQNHWQREQNHKNLLNFQAFGGRERPDPW